MKTILTAVLLLASAAVAAGESATIDIRILRDGEAFEFNSDAAGFNPLDLQVGENRAYVDGSGRNVLITRTADGFTVDADGQTFDIPGPDILHDGDRHHVHAVEVEERMAFPGPDETLIVTRNPVDADTQAKIRSLLADAGHDANVRFVDAIEGPPGPPRPRVHVIREKTD